jgi:hypothetical protein
MTTTYTPPRLTPLGWLVDEQTWLGYWLLVERRHWFESETQAWKFHNDNTWNRLPDRLRAAQILLNKYPLAEYER